MILILLFQVKQYSAFKKRVTPDVFCIEDCIREEVLGQHGIRLLMERKGSFFHPGVLGILCIGTKVHGYHDFYYAWTNLKDYGASTKYGLFVSLSSCLSRQNFSLAILFSCASKSLMIYNSYILWKSYSPRPIQVGGGRDCRFKLLGR